MTVAVVFPWRPQAARLAAYEYVRSWYARELPDALVGEVDTDHEPFNLAACRNKAVKLAEEMGADVVVISDADTVFAPADSLHAAIAAAQSDQRMHMPFTAQQYLTREETETVMAGGTIPLAGHHGNGACYVIQPAAYWAAGGSDERFSGWGGDDDQLVAACMAMVGLDRHWGTALSLWHPAVRDVGSERHRPNAELAHRYWAARNSRTKMRRLIAERQ